MANQLHSQDSQGTSISDPLIQDIADVVLAKVKTSTYRVAMDVGMSNSESRLDQIIASRFNALSPIQKARAEATIRARHASPIPRTEDLGPYANLSLKLPALLNETLMPAELRKSLKRVQHVTRVAGLDGLLNTLNLGDTELRMASVHAQPRYANNTARFVIDEVKCLDETGPDWLGSDEIYLVGVNVDETGDVHKLNWKISNDFDTGERVTRDFRVVFNITEGGNQWPKKYFVALTMIEQDLGNVPAFVHELYTEVRKEITAIVVQMAASGEGGEHGVLIAAAALAAGWVLDQALDWFIKIWEDDVIGNVTYTFTHAGPAATFGGNNRSAPRNIVLRGAGGRYRLRTY